MEPILLPSNQPPARFYRGGQRISEFRGEPPSPPNTPEDWVASTTSVRGNAPIGMTRLVDGQLLAEVVAADPVSWLGPRHVENYGDDTMLLVKLLDAGERLPVHAHPDGTFASEHISARHGKAEAWYILSAGTVHLGLTHTLSVQDLLSLVAAQDSAAMLSLMHQVSVEPGDCVFVPHGVLHSVGPGILLVEVQEPEDLSILLEWKGFDLDGDNDGHLGLGFDVALTAVETQARSTDEIAALLRHGITDGTQLPTEAERYFRLDRVSGRRDFVSGFGIVIALDDDTRLTPDSGTTLDLPVGSTTLVPFAAGNFRVDGIALLARPPRA